MTIYDSSAVGATQTQIWNSTTVTSTQPYYYDISNGPSKGSYPEIVIKRDGKPDILVGETLEAILDRLAMLSPDFEKMEKYPALREAYENYRLIEAMIAAGEDGE